ncbi:298_t:CDS:2 [Entrophospora sp. SA101]|nr:298_t:CDS:2 [Entrophospora sp. SA101]
MRRFELAKADANPIPTLIYLNQRVVLSEVQNLITIGYNQEANLWIDNPSVAGFKTIIKNGWSKRTFVNDKLLGPNEDFVVYFPLSLPTTRGYANASCAL